MGWHQRNGEVVKGGVHLGFKVGTGEPVSIPLRHMVVTEADGNWLAGLTDGEGCFFMAVRDRAAPRTFSVDFVFKIALRADDRETLERAKTILCGMGIFSLSGRNRNPLLTLRIQRKTHIREVIRFFRSFELRSKKRRDFELWAEAFELLQSAIDTATRNISRSGVLDRPSRVCRRPMAGEPLMRFHTTPPEVIAQLREMSAALRNGRKFQ